MVGSSPRTGNSHPNYQRSAEFFAWYFYLPWEKLTGDESVLTLLAGPALALFPKRWRERFTLTSAEWKLVGMVSGIVESVAALAALVAWYSYSVTHWAQAVIFSTAEAHPQAAIPPGTEGFAALVLLLFHPLTWFIFYCGIEGIVRFLAAGISGTVLGIFPLFLLEHSYSFLSSRRTKSHSPASDSLESDLLATRTDAEGEILEIRSLKPKEGWDPPKIVRFQGVYYRLFQAYEEHATSRCFVYVLRRLSAGVHSWTVIDYSANFRSVDPDETKPKD